MNVDRRIHRKEIEKIREEGAEVALREAIAGKLEKIIECIQVLQSDELRQWDERTNEIGKLFQDAHTLERAIPDETPKPTKEK